MTLSSYLCFMFVLLFVLVLSMAQDPTVQEHLRAQQAYSADPKSEDRLVALVSILYREEQNRKAIDLLEPFVTASPTASRARLFLALGYAREEMYDKARTLAEEVVTESPTDHYAQHVLGLSLFGLHRHDEAEVRFKRALELKPDFAESYFELGLLYGLAPETLGKAITCLTRALELSYPQAEVYRNLGSVNIKLGRYDEAIRQLNMALKLDPESKETYYVLSTALRNSGSTAEATEAMKHFQSLSVAALDKRQRGARSWDMYREGMDLLSKDEFAKAYDAFKNAADTNPELDPAYYRLAQINYLRGDKAHALLNIREALHWNPFEPEYYFVLARSMEDTDVPSAINAATKAASLNPKVADFHNLLGDLYQKTGDYAHAVQSYVRATELEPSNEAFRSNLAAARRKLPRKQ